MRSRFDSQLNDLNKKLIEMGSLIEYAISRAMQSLNEQNEEIAKQVIIDDEIVNEKEKEIESLCLKLLLNQQPVAKDLRLISVALKIITDMERIGDQAADISKISIDLSNQKYIKKLEHISQMGNETIKMLNNSIDAFVKKDSKLAKSVIADDDIIDRLYITVKEDLINLIHMDINTGQQAFDLLQIAKYYEKIGDHSVNIAKWVIFSITGKHI